MSESTDICPEGCPEVCVVCAWRATCQKKFSISGRDMRCADFTRDVTLESQPAQDADPATSNSKKK